MLLSSSQGVGVYIFIRSPTLGCGCLQLHLNHARHFVPCSSCPLHLSHGTRQTDQYSVGFTVLRDAQGLQKNIGLSQTTNSIPRQQHLKSFTQVTICHKTTTRGELFISR